MLGNITQKALFSVQIAKIPLCLLIAFSAFFGFVFYKEEITQHAFTVFLAVLLLSSGGATLNSYQERKTDALLSRTSNRPLVHNKLPYIHVLLQAVFLSITGLLILYVLDKASFLVGVVGLLLYNVVYTPLKLKTIYSLIPGAICGAAPPYIGWLAAGGEYFSFRALLPVMLLIFWQIPHFFLVLLIHQSDYLRNMLPNVLYRLSESGVRRIFLPWSTALVCIMLIFTVIPSPLKGIFRLGVVANALLLLVFFCHQLLAIKKTNYSRLFKYMNISMFLHMLFICIGLSIFHW